MVSLRNIFARCALTLAVAIACSISTFAQLPPADESPPQQSPPVQSPPAQSYPALDLTGTWRGALVQRPANPGQSNYSVVVQIPSLEKATVEYPSLHCGGNLNLIRYDDSSATFREWITWGKENAIDGGTVVIRQIDDHTASFRWTDSNPRSGVVCTGQIMRQ